MLVGKGRRSKPGGELPQRSPPPIQTVAESPFPFLRFPSRTPPGLTSVHLFLSCRCTLGDSREVGAQAVQIPPSPAWCVGEGLGARTYSPEAPGDPRLSAQGPAAGEQAGQQAWFLGIQFPGSHTPSSCTFFWPFPLKAAQFWSLPQPKPAPSLTLPPPRTISGPSKNPPSL